MKDVRSQGGFSSADKGWGGTIFRDFVRTFFIDVFLSKFMLIQKPKI